MEGSKVETTKQVIHANRKPESAGAKVVVGCKLPNGLSIRPCRMVASRELTLAGSREIRIAEPVGLPIRIKGNAVPVGLIPRHKIVKGFALTEGVSKEHWDQWLKDNHESSIVQNGLIWAEKDVESAEAHAKQEGDVLSGLEPFRRDGDSRKPGSINPNLSDVEEEEERAAKAA